MFNDPTRISDAIGNPKFHRGDPVVLTHGPHKYDRGIFLSLKEDVEWAAVEAPDGTVSSHPVEWMESYRPPERNNISSTSKNL